MLLYCVMELQKFQSPLNTEKCETVMEIRQ